MPAPKDLLTILYQPRETMRRILDAGPDRWAVQIVLLAFVCTAVSDADAGRLNQTFPGMKMVPVLAIVALTMILSALGWVLFLYLVGWVTTAIGRALGGEGTVADVRAAVAWAMVPLIWSVIYRIPATIFATHFHYTTMNSREMIFNFLAHGGCSIAIVYFAVRFLVSLLCLYVASNTIGEAQRFSSPMGLASIALTLALPLAVAAAAVLAVHQ